MQSLSIGNCLFNFQNIRERKIEEERKRIEEEERILEEQRKKIEEEDKIAKEKAAEEAEAEAGTEDRGRTPRRRRSNFLKNAFKIFI